MRVRYPGVNYSKSLQSATLTYVQRSDGDERSDSDASAAAAIVTD